MKNKKNINIEYTKNLTNITENQLTDFFAGWKTPPDPSTHLKILQKSYRVYLAIDKDTHRVVGFINAISDGVLTVYIPLLEILKNYQGLGIGSKLVELMLDECKDFYMIDICHDVELTAFYKKFGAMQSCASIFRNFAMQRGSLTHNNLQSHNMM